jgi:glycosyl transferase family 87
MMRAAMATRVAAAVFAVALVGLLLLHSGSEPHYRLNEATAIRAAATDAKVAAFLRRHPYTRAESIALDRRLRRVTFFDGPRVVLDAAVDPRGRVRFTQEHRPNAPESGSRVANSPWVLALLAALFVLATAVAPLRRLRNLDVAALVSFTAIVVMINERLVVASAAAAVVPLAYLICRCLWLALRPAGAGAPATPLFGRLTEGMEAVARRRLLLEILGAAGVAFLVVTLTSAGESDVASASLSGATELLHGRAPYGHIVSSVVHGDTYPLLTYVLYIPGAVLTPVTDAFSDRTGALVVTAAAGLAAAVAIWRTAARAGEGGSLAGPLAVLAWLCFPPVLLTASGGSNDMVLAALLAWALCLAAAAGRSTLLLTAAAWTKVVPLALAPVWLARLERRQVPRALAAAAGLTAALCLWLFALDGTGAVGDMLDALSFQFQRGSFHAPWIPFGIEWLQPVVQAGLVAAVAGLALRARTDAEFARDPVRIAAALGAVLLWVQVAANYWTWAYLPWVLPFVLASLLSDPRSSAAGSVTR